MVKQQLKSLLIKTIALRKAQAEAYEYHDFNTVRLNAAWLLSALSELEAGQLDQMELGLEHSLEAQKLISADEETLVENEHIYQIAQIYLTLANIQESNDLRSKAKHSFRQAIKFLTKIANDSDLESSVVEQLNTEIEAVSLRLQD